MKKMVLAGLAIVCSVVIVVSFFMPWARASVSATKVAKGMKDTVAGPLKKASFGGKFIDKLDAATNAISKVGDIEVKTTISGYDIPTLVNKKSSKVAISLAQVFAKDLEGVDKKVLLVYLIPLLALVCIALAVIGIKNKIAVITMTVIGAAIGIVGLYKLMSTNLANLTIQISIERGLWQTLYAYLLIGIIGIIWLVLDRPGTNPKS